MVISFTNALGISAPYCSALKYKWRALIFSHLYQQTPEIILQHEEQQLKKKIKKEVNQKKDKTESERKELKVHY